ncbi:MAG: 2-C-methyl-D-erythritol 4-phosphate cytidylyltransferase [Deltaproteobacteria bacterium]|jgi:2-C-methyl-D-erythritol 4-phosphate cytidylyltransferase|nr:2-C-methyl-D-erythritol 4-phosphate cytidylyltransferase [Deltaproteobacteria bacterium]
MKTAAIIAAAGIGRRMGAGRPKQYLELAGRPIICHTLDRFVEACVDELVIVVEPGREGSFKAEILGDFGFPDGWLIVAGGDVRQRSVYNGLCATSEVDVVMVHDGVRPFITKAQIELLAKTALDRGSCILASPIKETVKKVDAGGAIMETVDRSDLWGAQTPQAFRRSLLMSAMESAFKENFMGTDEASIVERLGEKVSVVEGDSRNVKITTPSDLIVAEAILEEWR